jgi:Family of unknown function (DUF6677)
MAETEAQTPPQPPIGTWLPAVVAGWLIPGGGHLLLKKKGRAAMILACVVLMFLFGLAMRGAMFTLSIPPGTDLLTKLITYGGWVGDLANGMLYFLATWFGYSQVDVAGHVHDYGTKFMVSAGLLNILSMVDAYEIAIGKKN